MPPVRIPHTDLANGHLYYLASPYSSGADPNLMSLRALRVRMAAGALFAHSISVFSPITYTHDLALNFKLPKDAAFWRPLNDTIALSCAGLIIYLLQDWHKSAGVADEYSFFKLHQKPVFGLLPFVNALVDPPQLFALD